MIIKQQIKAKKELIKEVAIEATKEFFDGFKIRLERGYIADEILNNNRAIIIFHPRFVIKEHTESDGIYTEAVYDEAKRELVSTYLLKQIVKNVKKLTPKGYKFKLTIPDLNKKGRVKNNEAYERFGIEQCKPDCIKCVVKLSHR